VTLSLIGALIAILAFGFGFLANRAGTCLVLAVREVHRSRPPRMFAGFLVAACMAGLVAAPLDWAGLPGAGRPGVTAVTAALLTGAAAFGLGAFVNDTCLLGSLVRLGNGETRLIALPAGLAAGFLITDALPAAAAPTWPGPLAAPGPAAFVLLAGLAVLGALGMVFLARRGGRSRRRGRTLALTMAGLGIAGGALYVLASAWTVSDLVRAGLPLRMPVAGGMTLLTVAAALAGSLVAAALSGKLRLRAPSAAGLGRSLAGGALMGAGAGLIPGGNDDLILSGLPNLSPGAAAALAAMAAAILGAMTLTDRLARHRRGARS